MKTSSPLSSADKYNWWTNQKDKSDISTETRLGYIMTDGDTREVFSIFQSFPKDTLQTSFNRVKDDAFAMKNRRKYFIKTLFQEKEAHTI
jgi:hypothetical protein